jgi:hypothetical protein
MLFGGTTVVIMEMNGEQRKGEKNLGTSVLHAEV